MAIFSGIAAAIGSIFTAVSGFIGGLGAIGSFVLKTAVGIGLNLAAKALAGDKQQEQPKFSVQGKIQASGDVPRSFALSYSATAGSLVYHNTYGKSKEDHVTTPNAYYVQVIALSDLPVSGLAEVWVNGERVTLGPTMAVTNSGYEIGYPVTEYFDDGNDHVWVKFYDGTQTAADPRLVYLFGSDPVRPYQNTRVGTGCAYAVVTSRVDDKLFTGFPQFKFALNGLKLYDPSKDTSVGGVGPQRWATPSTWGGDGDHLPAAQLYNLLRGLTFGGKWFYGLQGMSAARLPAAHWIAEIAKCRAAITSGGATVPTYRSGGEIHVSAPLADAAEALLTTCQGRLSEAGGVYKAFVGAPGAPLLSFTDGDIISTAEQSFTPFFGLADTVNGMAGKHPNPAEGWNVKVAPPIYRSDLEALAGNRRLMADVSFDLVPYGDQVQRLMKSALDEAQRARRHTFVLPPEIWVLEPGDIVSWTSARNGYVTKLFRIDGMVDRANLDVMVDMTEVDPSDYDWNDATDYRVPVDGPVIIVRPAPQPIVDWSATASSIPDNTGTGRRPAILLAWDGNVDDVAAVAFEVRLATTLEVIYRGRTDNFAAGSILISQSLLPNVSYAARGRYVPASDRRTDWSSWLPVTTPNLKITIDDILAGTITELALADRSISELKIKLATLGALVIAPAAIEADKIATNAVTELKIAALAVSEAKVAVAAVSTSKIAALAVESTKIQNLAVSTGKLADGAITNLKLGALAVEAGNIATNAITETKILDNSISTGKVQANAIVAAKIAAQAITATKLVIGDYSNMWPDFDFEDPAFYTGANYSLVLTASPLLGKRYLQVNNTGANNDLVTGWMAIDEAVEHMAKMRAWVGGAGGEATAFIQTGELDGNGNVVNVVTAATIVNAQTNLAPTEYTYQLTAVQLATAKRLRFVLRSPSTSTQPARFGAFVLRRRVNAEIIVDGSIITDKLAANAVTAVKIAANTITATQIAAGTITGTEIAANAITAVKILAGTITGDKIQAGTITGNLVQAATLTGDKLVANSITAREMILTDYSNLAIEPYFENAGVTWTFGANATILDNPSIAPSGQRYSLTITGAAGLKAINQNLASVKPGENLTLVSAMNRAGSGADVQVRCRFQDQAGTFLSAQSITFTGTETLNTWVRKTLAVVVPADAAKVQIDCNLLAATGSFWRLGYISLFRAANAELIVDGSITALKIEAGAVTAVAIAAGAVTASKISVGTLSAIAANVGTLTAGILQSADGKFVINLTNGSLEWFD